MTLKSCPGCGSANVDPAGHSITIEIPEGELIAGATSTVRGPLCLDCGFWSARGDRTDAENVAGWNKLERVPLEPD